MRFTSLGSGSAGNALYVEQGSTRLLLDCGLPIRSLESRLLARHIDPFQIQAILLTHEHGDHVQSCASFAAKYDCAVYATFGTFNALPKLTQRIAAIQPIDSESVFEIGDLEIYAYTVPHDAKQPVQYRLNNGDKILGVLTDVGHITTHIAQVLSACDALILECNHEPALLAASRYPASVIRRVGGEYGHLANAQAAELLGRIKTDKLQHLIAAHLSAENNQPILAQTALSQVLNCSPDWIQVADQLHGFDWRDL